MTRGSVREYVEALRPRYQRAGRKERSRLLDEFTQVTGYHRKAAIRLLAGEAGPAPGRKRGRPRVYGSATVAALTAMWKASDHLCGKRLQPFLPELLAVLQRHGEVAVDPAVAAQLGQMSAATIDRLLKPARQGRRPRARSTTKPGSLLKAAIPIRTFTEWTEDRPGFLEVDLVAPCGESTEGFYLTTLSAVDIITGWVECEAVWGKGQERVGSGIHRLRQRLPFPLLGLDSDNGSEFINHHLFAYCQREGITFTRSRPYKKNDNAHIEQKNWMAVRRLVGYDRYTSQAALAQLAAVYRPLRLYLNFFQPGMKLVTKERQGARVRKRYDAAQTPYQRLLASGTLTPEQEAAPQRQYVHLNPVRLRRQIQEALDRLWSLADLPGTQ